MTADIKLLPLPEELATEYRLLSRTGHHEAVEAYARANVEHHIAAKDAEIEALRADVGTATRMHAITREHLEAAEARAERLAEALRIAYRHLDMDSMRVSHCKDAAAIDGAQHERPYLATREARG